MNIEIYDKLHKDAMYIRTEVFTKEQGFVNEFDDIDERCKHLVVYHEGKPIGTCRIYNSDEGSYVIGRIAVLRDSRSLGLGKMIVEKAEEYIKEQGGTAIKLSAQVRVKGFYQKLGYVCAGEQYMDEACPHISMQKHLC